MIHPFPVGLIPLASNDLLAELLGRDDLDNTTYELIMEELDNRKYDFGARRALDLMLSDEDFDGLRVDGMEEAD